MVVRNLGAVPSGNIRPAMSKSDERSPRMACPKFSWYFGRSLPSPVCGVGGTRVGVPGVEQVCAKSRHSFVRESRPPCCACHISTWNDDDDSARIAAQTVSTCLREGVCQLLLPTGLGLPKFTLLSTRFCGRMSGSSSGGGAWRRSMVLWTRLCA